MPDSNAQATNAQATADRVRAQMLAADRVAQQMGMQVDAVAPGAARVCMAVREQMLNGHGICHGGLVATLADTAFAYACNARNERTVAAGFSIDLVAPARLGDLLTATASELAKAGRTGVYDVDVVNQRGERVALFRGRSHTLKGQPVVAD